MNYDSSGTIEKNISYFNFKNSSVQVLIAIWTLISFSFCMIKLITTKNNIQLIDILQYLKQYFIKISLAVLLLYLPIALIPGDYFWLAYLLFPPHFAIILMEKFTTNDKWNNKSIMSLFAKAHKTWPNFLLLYLIIICIVYLGQAFITSPVAGFIIDFIQWHDIFDSFKAESIFVHHILNWVLFCIIAPLVYYILSNEIYSNHCKESASDLQLKFESFGKDSSVFEKA